MPFFLRDCSEQVLSHLVLGRRREKSKVTQVSLRLTPLQHLSQQATAVV